MNEYLVLVPCRNDDTGVRFQPGETVTADEFPAAVIANWLQIEPPVLAEMPELPDQDGSDAEEEE